VLHSGNRLETAADRRLKTAAMSNAVVAGALAVAALNAAPGALGGWLWYRGDPATQPSLSNAFWVLLRVGQGSAVTLAVAVGSLVAAGKDSSDSLFYLYALLPLAVGLVAEQLRVTAAQTILDQRGVPDAQAVAGLPEAEQQALVGAIVRREIGVMASSALVVVFLALRAAGTAHGF
jgi:hypothetical protein